MILPLKSRRVTTLSSDDPDVAEFMQLVEQAELIDSGDAP
jgi:hypothetical protein